jgi:hypothetical protein
MIEINDGKYILVASDIHSSDQTFETLAAMASAEGCLAFIYAGDLDIDNYFIAQSVQCRNYVFLPVQGNCDNRWSWTDVGLDLPSFRTCTFDNLKIFVSHGHLYYEPSSVGLEDSDFDMVITGHTHVPDLHTEFIAGKRVVFLNPGSAARPRGGSRASYALIRFRKNGKVSAEIRTLSGDDLLSEETISVDKSPERNY